MPFFYLFFLLLNTPQKGYEKTQSTFVGFALLFLAMFGGCRSRGRSFIVLVALVVCRGGGVSDRGRGLDMCLIH